MGAIGFKIIRTESGHDPAHSLGVKCEETSGSGR